MHYLIAFFLTFTLLAGNAALAGEKRPNLKNLDQTILLDAGKSPRMYVKFNHLSHHDIKCRNCHHTGLPGNRYADCTSKGCHDIPGARERGEHSVYMAYHAPDTTRSCYGCHKPLAGQYPNFKGCRPCHIVPHGGVAAKAPQKQVELIAPSFTQKHDASAYFGRPSF